MCCDYLGCRDFSGNRQAQTALRKGIVQRSTSVNAQQRSDAVSGLSSRLFKILLLRSSGSGTYLKQSVFRLHAGAHIPFLAVEMKQG